VTGTPRASAGPTLEAAYAECARIARRHYENFPVASLLLPRRMRPHVAAIYAFARVADDFADEGDRSPAERLRLLDGWSDALVEAAAPAEAGAPPRGRGHEPAASPSGGGVVSDADAATIFAALGETIRACRLPVPLFEDLLSAFRQDVTVSRYATWNDLLDYCRRSANPVGRLVLRVAGYDDEALDRSSDALCTALQMANFWQDLGRDWRKGRLYIPVDELERHGAKPNEPWRGADADAWSRTLAEMCRRTRELFDAGREVCDGVGGRLRLELRLTWLGGMTILDRVERAGLDVLTDRPALGAADMPRLLWRAALWAG